MAKFVEISEQEPMWEWNDGSWHRFDKKSEKEIEASYQKDNKGTVVVTVNYTQYQITFSDMQQMNMSSKYKRNIRRNVQKKNQVRVNAEELYKIFGKYKESESGVMDGDGIMKFAKENGVDPMKDITLLVLFWKIGPERSFYFTEKEFVNGLAKLGMETAGKIKQRIGQLKNELSDVGKFKQFYAFVFGFLKESPSAKTLPPETAAETWRMVLQGRYKYLEDWIKFVTEHHKRSISLDTWKQFYEFTQDANFKSFDTFDTSDSAYPTIIDDFVQHMISSKKN